MTDQKVHNRAAPGRGAWSAIASLALGSFSLVTAEFLPASLLPPIAADLSISPGLAGQTVTATAVIAAFAGPGIVVGTRRMDRRLVLLGLSALLVVSSVIAATAGGFAPLLLARLLLGVALGGFWALSAAFAMRLVPEDHLPRAMSIVMAGVSVATVCAAPVGAWIGATLGWRFAFFLTAGLGLIAFVIQALTVPALPPAGHAGFSTMVRLLGRPALRRVFLVIILAVAGHFAGFTFIRSYLEDVIHLDVTTVSLVLLGFGIAGFFGNLIGGAIAGRTSSGALALAAGVIALAAAVMVGAATIPALAIGAVVFWGLGFGGLPVSAQSRITRIASDEVESAGALMLTTFQIAISTGAIAGGLLIDGQGPLGVIGFAGIAAALGAWVMLAGGARQPAEAKANG
ncbi:putative MFS family arabinose efflux permease [Rhizobium petrolearium]|uniref:MFS transporter n=1 Tax=Neorhizobium petrolearium TaxID=515361 RepID=UPI001AE1CF8C|nr:MFS transporter [Neorhizobium petrolearium]MBP1846013.1 putative MFS family arabinose efflux permease [Neorhizobium petrolearium]